ncbi:MAG: nitroreductase family protein [Chloroflexota bacterium]
MEFDDLVKLIRERRSIRVWEDKPVPESLLVKALQLAVWAPNGGNQQNWHFYVILNRETLNRIADAVQASADQVASWPEAKEHGDVASGWRERAGFFRSAPAAIVVATSQYQSLPDQVMAAREKTDPQAAQMRQWRNTADSRIQSASAATAYLVLVLHALGLGAVWMTGPMQAKGEIEKILHVPPSMDVITFIPVGYPAESPAPRARRPFSEVCEVLR